MKRTTKTFISLALCHWLGDCSSGVWPIYKYLAGLDLAKAGFIATATVFLGSGLQPFFGYWSDKGWQRRLILVGTALTAMTMLLGPVTFLKESVPVNLWYGLMFLIMLVATMGAGMFHPAGTSLAGNLNHDRRSTLVSLFIGCGMIGFSMSQGLFSYMFRVTQAHTELFMIPGAAIVTLGVLWCRPQQKIDDPRHLSTGRWEALKVIKGRLAVLYFFQVMMGGMFHAFIFLMPEFLEIKGLPGGVIRGGGYFCWVAGSVVMMIPAGHLADRFKVKVILVWLSILAVIVYYFIVMVPSLTVWGYLVMFFVGGGFAGSVNPLSVAMGQRLAPQHASLISGILMGMAWAGGSVFIGIAGFMAEQPSIGVVGTLRYLTIMGAVGVLLMLGLRTKDR